MHRPHIAIFEIPAHGHINPTLAMVSELVARGFRVTYSATEQFSSRISEAGAEVIPFHTNYLTKAQPSPFMPEDAICIMLEGVDAAISAFTQLSEFYEKNRPDLILYDGLAYAGRIFSLKWNIPAVELHPNFAKNEQFSYLKSCLGSNQAPLELSSKKFNDFLSAQGISTKNEYYFDNVENCNIVFLPKFYQIKSDTFDDRFSFVGPCLSKRAFYGSWKKPEDENRPIVLVSLGTIFNDVPDFFKTCIQAFSDFNWHVIMSLGGNVDLNSLGPIPPNFEIYQYVLHLEILPHAKIFISHAGMNSVMEALYYGVPMVLIPQIADDEMNADRIEELHLGKRLSKLELTAEGLRETVLEVAGNNLIQHQVEQMQQAVRTAGGAKEAANRIEEYLSSPA